MIIFLFFLLLASAPASVHGQTVPVERGIIDMQNGNVFLSFGAKSGVERGDEYLVLDPDIAGLFIVKEVYEEFSIAKVIFSKAEDEIEGDLSKVSRVGLDTSLYSHVIIHTDAFDDDVEPVIVFGARQSFLKGLYSIRPFVGLEVPVSPVESLDLSGLVFELFAGGELSWYLWRFQFVPSAAVGISGSIPLSQDDTVSFSHVGGSVEMSIQFLVSADLRVSLDGGYAAWFAIVPGETDPYWGPMFGLGANYRY